MALSDEKIREYQKRLILARTRILCNHGFYGLLLMHMRYAIDETAKTAYTDSRRIAFGPMFLERLSDSELDFIMMHEILHVVLQHCFCAQDLDRERYNIAADIVVNSNIMLENGGNKSSISLSEFGGECMHIAPNGKEGHLYTAEEVYEMLSFSPNKNGKPNSQSGGAGSKPMPGLCDDHSHWEESDGDSTLRDVWVKRFEDACKAIEQREAAEGRGLLPAFARRILRQLRKPQTDWRTILNDFVQEEIVDYSFSPPDRRFDDSPFFLPDLNEKEDMLEDILFMIDTSGSVSDDMVAAAYSEVKGAIDQFDGKLKGWLGFFDAAIIEPKPFESFDDLKKIKPVGGGGTDFQIIFDYVRQFMSDRPPACIIVLTDGIAPFPHESEANGIPVLWLLCSENITSPWGKIARISVP